MHLKLPNARPEEIEEGLLEEHLQQLQFYPREQELRLAWELPRTLAASKKEGERPDFQKRVKEEIHLAFSADVAKCKREELIPQLQR